MVKSLRYFHRNKGSRKITDGFNFGNEGRSKDIEILLV